MRRTLLAALLALTPHVAHADHLPTDAGVLVAEGIITPGLPTAGCTTQQSLFFAGSIRVEGDHAGTYSVYFNGNGTGCSGIVSGSAEGTVSGYLYGNLRLDWLGTDVRLSGDLVLWDVPHRVAHAGCQWAWTSMDPVRTYALACAPLVLAARH